MRTAVIVEPTACAVHAALSAGDRRPATLVAVIGAGTLGLATVAALHHLVRPQSPLHGDGRAPSTRTSATWPSRSAPTPRGPPDQLARAVRRRSVRWSWPAGSPTEPTWSSTAWAPRSRSTQALAMVRPRGPGGRWSACPAGSSIDLAPLWHRELTLVGAYAYGTETRAERRRTDSRTFELAIELVAAAGLGLAGLGQLPARAVRGGHRPRRCRRAPGRGRRWSSTCREPRKEQHAMSPQARFRARRRPLDSAHPVLARRALQPRAPARGQPGHLRPRADRSADRPRGRPSATPSTTRWATGTPVRPPPAGDEADHRLRRHLAAPSPHGAARHPPDGHRAGPRHGRRRPAWTTSPSSWPWPSTGG